MSLTQILFYNNLLDLTLKLSSTHDIFKDTNKSFDFFMRKKVIIEHKKENSYNTINIWNSQCFYNYYFNNIDNNNMICSINYIINNDNIEIYNFKGSPLNKYILLLYIENIAKYNNISTLIVNDVDYNDNKNFYKYFPIHLIIKLKTNNYLQFLSK